MKISFKSLINKVMIHLISTWLTCGIDSIIHRPTQTVVISMGVGTGAIMKADGWRAIVTLIYINFTVIPFES